MKAWHRLHKMPSKILGKVRSNVRYKLLLLVLFPLLVIPLAVGAAIYWGHSLTYEQLYIKVNTDLSVSNNIFQRLQDDYLRQLERFAESYALRAALDQGNQASIQAQVNRLQAAGGFDYLLFNESSRFQSKVTLTTTPTTTPKDNRPLGKPSRLQTAALQGRAGTGIELFSPADLQAIDPALSQRVRLPLLPTPYARPTERTLEDRGMLVRAVYPVRDADGKVRAVLDGGVLLNGNFELVDAIRELVYGQGSLPEGSIGTVTIFLDDVRISTNVPLHPGERALGTRVSTAVYQQVVDRGENWVDRAFVVNDWYISGYSPIEDLNGQRVGMLYAGYLEAPFRNDLWWAVLALLTLLAALSGLSLFISLRGAQSIFHPLEQISQVVQEVRAGQGAARVGVVDSEDELAELARAFDGMLDLLQQRKREIERWAGELETKVAARTNELTARNEDLSNTIQALRQTRRKLVVAEKLAGLGQLTAGVAHEINNPVAVILGNIDMLSMTLGEAATPVQQEIDLIIEQIYRIQEIINNLLQYARPGEFSNYLEKIDVNQVVEQTSRLIEHLRRQKPFQLQTDYQASQFVEINAHELQQVLVNLIRNAVYAIPAQNGLIQITTRDWQDKGVIITVQDNGAGIPDEQLDKIFSPFFTTKQQADSEGTGLGLSLSYSLIHRYGGHISVQSPPGQGALFTIWLRIKPQMIEDEQTLVEQLFEIEQAQFKNPPDQSPHLHRPVDRLTEPASTDH